MKEWESSQGRVRVVGESGKGELGNKKLEKSTTQKESGTYSFFRKARLTLEEIEEFTEMGVELKRYERKLA